MHGLICLYWWVQCSLLTSQEIVSLLCIFLSLKILRRLASIVGGAVLAYLYRELCLSTSLQRRQIGGALILLQMWSWERFPFGCPLPRQQEPELGGDDIVSRLPYDYKWSGPHKFAEHVTCRLTGGYRDDIDCFTDDTKVNWTPYEQEKHLLPPSALTTPICG